MDRPEFRLSDTAKLLDAVVEVEPPREAVALLERALRRLPKALDLHQPILPAASGSPSLLDLAKLLVAVGSAVVLPECRTTARWLIAQGSEEGAEHLRQLDTMARNAGWWPTLEHSYAALLSLEQQYDLLLAADGWDDPADALDPSRECGLDYDALHSIATAKLAQASEEERTRRAVVHRRLQRYAEKHRGLESIDQKLDHLRALFQTQAISPDQLEGTLQLIHLVKENRHAGSEDH